MQEALTEAELMSRANKLAGRTLSDFFTASTKDDWKNTYRKGTVGQLIEKLLGAESHSKPQPDFFELGIELKTIPLNIHGKPLESTYVCHMPFPAQTTIWEEALVYQKLRKVLWVPIIGTAKTPLHLRRIGIPILWRMSLLESQWLKTDWAELNELMLTGQQDQLSATHGQYLQCRPKAQNSQSQIKVGLSEGSEIFMIPKGYYLRTSFTAQIIAAHYRL